MSEEAEKNLERIMAERKLRRILEERAAKKAEPAPEEEPPGFIDRAKSAALDYAKEMVSPPSSEKELGQRIYDTTGKIAGAGVVNLWDLASGKIARNAAREGRMTLDGLRALREDPGGTLSQLPGAIAGSVKETAAGSMRGEPIIQSDRPLASVGDSALVVGGIGTAQNIASKVGSGARAVEKGSRAYAQKLRADDKIKRAQRVYKKRQAEGLEEAARHPNTKPLSEVNSRIKQLENAKLNAEAAGDFYGAHTYDRMITKARAEASNLQEVRRVTPSAPGRKSLRELGQSKRGAYTSKTIAGGHKAGAELAMDRSKVAQGLEYAGKASKNIATQMAAGGGAGAALFAGEPLTAAVILGGQMAARAILNSPAAMRGLAKMSGRLAKIAPQGGQPMRIPVAIGAVRQALTAGEITEDEAAALTTAIIQAN